MTFLRDSKINARSVDEVVTIFQDLLKTEDKISQDVEHLYVMHLDARHKVKLVEIVAIGTLNHMQVTSREIFRRAIVEGSATIIIGHNHPSREVEPSDDDVAFTTRIHDGGELLGIPMLDHIVFTTKDYYSFRQKGK